MQAVFLIEVFLIDGLNSALSAFDGLQEVWHTLTDLFGLLYACVDLVVVVLQQAFDFLGGLGAA